MNKYLYAILGLFICSVVSAQSTFAEHGLSFKRSFIDYLSPNSGSFGNFKDYNAGFEVGYLHGFSENIEGYVPIRLGVIKLEDEVDISNRVLAELDLQGRYRFYRDKKVEPFLLAGVGVVSENLDDINFQIPVGGGLDFRVGKSTFISFQGEFRVSLAEARNNLQFSLGFTHYLDKSTTMEEKIGEEMSKDTDGDGVTDDVDLCPEVAGLEAFGGCPDTDGDGIEDARDKCPKIAGLRALNGCPDSDGDGVSDNDDECPNLAGLIGNKGCPGDDTDDDGIPDDQDECPTVAGPIESNGCPDSDGDGVGDTKDLCPNDPGPRPNGCPDSDGDGLDDSEDRCPDQPGKIANKGCPELKVEDQELLRIAMRDVKFAHNKATLKPESYSVLGQIADLMNAYPAYTLNIGGHTDNTGSLSINEALSEKRAKSCYDYLVGKGIPSNRLTYKGYGPANPIADNNTQQGRALNRRVEFELRVE